MAPPKRSPGSARGRRPVRNPQSAIRNPQAAIRNSKSALRRPPPPRSRHPRSLAASIGPSDLVRSMIERLNTQAASFGLLDALDAEPALEYDPDPRSTP